MSLKIASKKALLATASFIMMGGISQAKVEVETQGDILGINLGSRLTKQQDFVMSDPKSLEKLLEQPLLEALQSKLPTAVDFMKEANLIQSTTAPQTNSPKSAAQVLADLNRLPTADVLNFAKLAYSANQQEQWTDEEKGIYMKLIDEGWELCPFNGTTGAADHQVESISGFMAFKEQHVVISTRGTEMTNWNDWMTNVRFSRSPFLRMLSSTEQNKISAITAQHFGLDGEIANGFLQTQLSSQDFIRNAILKRAEFLGVAPSELNITVTGHSLGGAKAQLIGLNLVTDQALDIGVRKLEDSFIDDNDLGMSGFFGMPVYSSPKNPENIEVIVFGSPRVFDTTMAKQVEEILGADIYRIENNDVKFFQSLNVTDVVGDIVPSLPPSIFGFAHVGNRIGDKGQKGVSLGRHTMSNVSKEATDDTDTLRAVRRIALQMNNTSKATDSVDKLQITNVVRSGFASPRIDLSRTAADISRTPAAPAA